MLTVFEIAALCSICILEPLFIDNFVRFITIFRFIPVPEVTTSEGKINVNGI